MPHRKKRRVSLFSVLLLLALVCAALALALLRPRGNPMEALNAALENARPAADGAGTGIDAALAEAFDRCLRYELSAPLERKLHSASYSVTRTALDGEKLSAGLADELQGLLAERASTAKRSAELYGADGAVLPAVYEELYTAALKARLAHAEAYCSEERIPVSLQYRAGQWELADADALAVSVPSRPGYAPEVLTPVALRYSLPPEGPGPVPNSACYGETSDAGEIAALLETATARRLINGQKLDFDPKRDMLGRPIYYYLDETILVLVWQQDEHGAVGTFAETFIADASQLRRKIADDSFGSYQYYYPHEFAQQTNAVLACSGDFYNSGRSDYGLYVYDGELMRYSLTAGESCLFSGEGDMLFAYENQFSSEEEARRFIRDNDVRFSLSFGPVLIDNGADVTPEDYYFGEVREGYARCCVGQLGHLHYLSATINCEYPDHDVYVTLRQAANTMLAHGCQNAYTLDGGQTGSILLGGRLINPVQFGEERQMSDIYYFATALSE